MCSDSKENMLGTTSQQKANKKEVDNPELPELETLTDLSLGYIHCSKDQQAHEQLSLFQDAACKHPHPPSSQTLRKAHE
jgi:hypothetical protein